MSLQEGVTYAIDYTETTAVIPSKPCEWNLCRGAAVPRPYSHTDTELFLIP